MLAAIFEMVMGILGGAGANPDSTSIVKQVFDAILSFLG